MIYSLDNFHPNREKSIHHVGLIPDGSGRWAIKANISVEDAYIFAVNRMGEFIQFCFDQKIDAVSIYFSSIQNFNRSESSISAFCDAQEYFCNNSLAEIPKKYKTKIRIAGRKDVLPDGFKSSLVRLQNSTKKYSTTRLYIVVAYNPLEEVYKAMKESDSVENFVNHLWVPEPLDLVIRTGDANVLSNFLPLQAGYARFYTLEKLFPEIAMDQYQEIFDEFVHLDRRFGD